MLELINEIETDFSDNIKNIIDEHLINAYNSICVLRSKLLEKKLEKEFFDEVKLKFISNSFDPNTLVLQSKYTLKYAVCISRFWRCYSYKKGNFISKGEYNLFEKMENDDLIVHRALYDDELALMLRRLEEMFVSSNQIYALIRLNNIKANYKR